TLERASRMVRGATLSALICGCSASDPTPDTSRKLSYPESRCTRATPKQPGASDCCGCLCRAPDWSCSEDTCVDVDGQALGLEPEAGFFELKAERYVSDGETRQSPLHRVWYSFQPADERPE